jgi:hypothetical protein
MFFRYVLLGMTWICPALAAVNQAKPLAKDPVPRSDLMSKLGETLCRSAEAPIPAKLWNLGIFDAQMEAAWITSSETLELDDLKVAAAREARNNRHLGYAFGLCSERRGWILSTAAPVPLLTETDHLLQVNIPALLGRCKSFDLDHAAAAMGVPKSIIRKRSVQTQGVQINTAFLEAGTLAVTCHPPDAKKDGPVLWALAPVGSWDREAIPFFHPIKHQSPEGLLQWLQEIRAKHSMAALNLEQPILQRFASQLIEETSLRHPRPLLQKQLRTLGAQQAQLLGENRVKASRLIDMAWLLWFSPQHRRLLLNPDANALGTQMSTLEHEKLLVLVLAKI